MEHQRNRAAFCLYYNYHAFRKESGDLEAPATSNDIATTCGQQVGKSLPVYHVVSVARA